MSAQREPVFDSDHIAIVDVPWDTDKAKDRRRIAAFLNELAGQHARRPPAAVILDVAFAPCDTYPEPCGEPMESARRALIAAIRNANARFDIYAREQPVLSHDDNATGATPHDPDIYAGLTGYGHTQFTALSNGLVYRACYTWNVLDRTGNIDGVEHLWDIIERVRMGTDFNRSACDATDFAVRVAADPLAAVQAVTTRLSTHGTFPPSRAFDDKYVIVGTVEDDPGYYAPLRGPQIVAWAISNVLAPGTAQNAHAAYDTDPENERLAVTVPAFSALTLMAYVAIFSVLKGTRLRTLRRALPWLAAGASAGVGLAAFAAFEALLLSSGHIQPQVTLIAIGIVTAAVLTSLRAFQVLFDAQWGIGAPRPEQYDYDVFISYAHEEGAWVAEHVYAPFRDVRLPDGRKLDIFFDTESIRYGTAWQDKIALAIDGSRFIVPVYSETYFGRPYCCFEIKRAHLNWINAGSESRVVLPVMRGKPHILPAVRDIQAQSIDDIPNLVQQIVAEVVDRLSHVSPHLPPAIFPCLALVAFAMCALPASAQTARIHTVKAIRIDGKDVSSASGVTVTPRNARPADVTHTIVRDAKIADGTRIDVPAHVVLIIVSTGGASTTTLEPGASITFVSTGKGELDRANGGRILFDVVHKSLDFFKVQYGDQITAGVSGTAFSLDGAAKTVSFACLRDAVTITRSGHIRIGQARKPGTLTDVVAARGRAAVSYGLDQKYIAEFPSFAAALAFYSAQVDAARKLGDVVTQIAALANAGHAQQLAGQYADATRTFRAALELAQHAGDRDSEARLTLYAGGVQFDRSEYADALHAYQQARALYLDAGDREGAASALASIGDVQWRQGLFAAALQSAQEALSVFTELNDRGGEAEALTSIGNAQYAQGRYGDALQSYGRALTLERELNDRDDEAVDLTDIGQVQYSLGQYDGAVHSLERSRAVFAELGDRAGDAADLVDIGKVHQSQGRYAEALQSFETARAVFAALGDRDNEAHALGNIGTVQEKQGRFADALATYQEVRAVFHELGSRDGEAAALTAIGNVQNAVGRFADALQSFHAALVVFDELGDRDQQANTLSDIGTVQSRLGQYADALQSLEAARTLFQQLGARNGEANADGNIGRVQERQGNYADALQSYESARVVFHEIGNRDGEARVLLNIGTAQFDEAKYDEAFGSYEAARVAAHDLGDRDVEAQALMGIANLQYARGRAADAVQSLQTARGIFHDLGDRDGEAGALSNLGHVQSDQGHYGDAKQSYQQARAIFQDIGDLGAEAAALYNIGQALEAQEKYPAALQAYQEAVAIYAQIGEQGAYAGLAQRGLDRLRARTGGSPLPSPNHSAAPAATTTSPATAPTPAPSPGREQAA